MRESNEEAAWDEEPPTAAAPFGLGLDPVRAADDSELREKPLARCVGTGEGGQRPLGFRCSLGRTWTRATPRDLGDALDAVLDAVHHAGAPDPGRLLPCLARTPFPVIEDWDELFQMFVEEDRAPGAQEHFRPPTPSELMALEPSAYGPEVSAVLLRAHGSEPLRGLCERLLAPLLQGLPVVLLSDSHLPCLAQAALHWIQGAVPDAPVALLHGNGLECLRHGATVPHLAMEIIEPEAGLMPWVASLRETRQRLLDEREAEALEEKLQRERRGWFGSGVVAPPIAPLRVEPAAPAPWTVAPDADPAQAAASLAERAFGPDVLGGYSTLAISSALIPRTIFSRVTEELLARLGEVGDDPRWDPPFWVLDRPTPSDVLHGARRFGLDEGATLIYERREARDDRKPYGLVFTNGEGRMRTGGAVRALGVLLLMRG